MADRELLLSLAGPILAAYLHDQQVIEVMINDNGTCFLTRHGIGMREVEPPKTAAVERFLGAVAHEVGREFRTESPGLSAALEDLGWRIEAGRPPLSPGVFMSLRKHPQRVFTLEDYERQGIITPTVRSILERAMLANERLIIAGGVGSAKTSLANGLLHIIRETQERILLCEDQPELLCSVRNCTRRYVVKGKWTLRDLIQSSLRLNPSRIIVGEVRGGEALDMLKAFQTGHGGLTTLHVDAAEHVMGRLEQLVQEVSASPQRELIGEVIDLIVHMEKHGVGWRCTGLLRVHGYRGEAYMTEPLM